MAQGDYRFKSKFHPEQSDPRLGGPQCIGLGHDPDDCEDGVVLTGAPILFTAECMQCGHEPLIYQDEMQRTDEVQKHVETTGHSVAIGWTQPI